MPVELPPPGEAALLLDLDGTLLDIAATPDAVVVTPGLVEALVRVRGAVGGALAIVSGRPIGQVEALLPGVATAVAGEHGGAIRAVPGGAVVRANLPELPEGLVEAAAALVALHPGAMLERKARGFVLHYRAVPEAGGALEAGAAGLIAPFGGRYQVMRALMAWEIRPVGVDKGSAVRAVMAAAPFAGRRPIFIGDDVTDEDGMAVARALGGVGLMVADAFGTAGGVRRWLSASAALGVEWAELR